MFPKKSTDAVGNWGWAAQQGQLVWRSHPRPELPPDWARLELLLGGVCGTDLQILAGYAEFTGFLGHEFVARVVECGNPHWLGRRVVGAINVADQVDPRFAPERRVLGLRGLDGAFAQTFMLPLRNLHPADDVPPELAVWSEPLAAALEAIQPIDPGARVLLVGDGRLASLIALALKDTHEVSVLGKHRRKLERLRQLGVEVVQEPGSEWPVVVEATGSVQGVRTALEVVAARGTVILKSTVAAAEPVDLNPIVLKALHVLGSRCGDIGAALQQLRAGRIDPRPLVDAIVPLQRLPDAIEGIQQQRWLKVLVSGPEPAGSGDDAQSH